MKALMLASVVLIGAQPAYAQSGATTLHTGHSPAATSSVDAVTFLEKARAATERYQNRAAAIADGYRRLGPSFPGMGEHWIHPGLIVSGRVDAAAPPVLCYADSAGIPMLVALAYAVPLSRGQAPPDTPFGRDVWHNHADAVDDESLLLIHPRAHEQDSREPRLAMFHTWTRLDNADGILAQNNWALPFLQLGLTPPREANAHAAQALSLLTVEEGYYMRLLEALARPSPAEAAAMSDAVDRAAARVREWVTQAEGDAAPIAPLSVLEAAWLRLWRDLDAAAGPATRARLQRYEGRPRD